MDGLLKLRSRTSGSLSLPFCSGSGLTPQGSCTWLSEFLGFRLPESLLGLSGVVSMVKFILWVLVSMACSWSRFDSGSSIG